jgi:hypothetical protein
MTRVQGIKALSEHGFYREALIVSKTGQLLCGLTDKAFEISELLNRLKCNSIVSKNGNYQRFTFSK